MIDLEQPEGIVLDQVREASTTTGFFLIRNHGISKDLADAALANCEALFKLPEDKKLSLKSETIFVVSVSFICYCSCK